MKRPMKAKANSDIKKCGSGMKSKVRQGCGRGSSQTRTRASSTDTTIYCRGLINLGKTCYMNSVLQVLVHTPIINNYFLTNRQTFSEEARRYEGKNPESWTLALHKLLIEFHRPDLKPVLPKDIFHLVRQTMPEMKARRQQDAHEFFCATINLLHKELVGHNRRGIKSETLIDTAFLGYMESKVSCTVCGKSRCTTDPFRNISLEVVSNDSHDGPVNLVDLLARFTQIENLSEPSDLLKCPACGTLTASTKQLNLSRLPTVLCIQLKRFSFNRQPDAKACCVKVKTRVSLPDSIDFTQFQGRAPALTVSKPLRKSPRLEQSIDENTKMYNLYAVVSHSGNYNSGHYRTYLRKAYCWICADDETVRPVSAPEAALESDAYLLFYQK